MGGRGTFASGNKVQFVYKTVGKIFGIKVLKGLFGKHALPEESRASYAYIKLKPNGIFHEMRFYGKDHLLKFEIAYHQEPHIDPSGMPILHYHVYGKDFKDRSDALPMSKAMIKHFKKYFKGVTRFDRRGRK